MFANVKLKNSNAILGFCLPVICFLAFCQSSLYGVDYTLTYTAGPNGTITSTTSQTVTQGLDGTAVTAVPNPGHNFVKWSDDVLTATRIDTNVTADINVTAVFDSSLSACGDNSYGQIGDGTQTQRLTPIEIISNVRRS